MPESVLGTQAFPSPSIPRHCAYLCARKHGHALLARRTPSKLSPAVSDTILLLVGDVDLHVDAGQCRYTRFPHSYVLFPAATVDPDASVGSNASNN